MYTEDKTYTFKNINKKQVSDVKANKIQGSEII